VKREKICGGFGGKEGWRLAFGGNLGGRRRKGKRLPGKNVADSKTSCVNLEWTIGGLERTKGVKVLVGEVEGEGGRITNGGAGLVR